MKLKISIQFKQIYKMKLKISTQAEIFSDIFPLTDDPAIVNDGGKFGKIYHDV